MANPTTYFGWVMPNSADLVTDLPADFAVFGQGVDTSMQDLLGGTTGQVLSKTSGTNMDFTWINNDTGDITGVTAGTGISGGGTSGTVTVSIDTAVTVDKTTAQTLTNKTLTSPALTTPTISTATTNGDMLYGTGSGALARLGIGSSAQVLTVASGVPSWATASGGGKVLQVVNQLYTTETTSSSGTLADTGITLNITPSSASSKILVLLTVQGCAKTVANSGNAVVLRLLRGATVIGSADYMNYTGTALELNQCWATTILDSPATTSATTYKVQFANSAGGIPAVKINYGTPNDKSTITLLEIGA